MSDNSIVKDFLNLKELEKLVELMKKEEKKPDPPKKWWQGNPIRWYILAVLSYPFVGKLYLTLLMKIW